jgi:hypothetical protein
MEIELSAVAFIRIEIACDLKEQNGFLMKTYLAGRFVTRFITDGSIFTSLRSEEIGQGEELVTADTREYSR